MSEEKEKPDQQAPASEEKEKPDQQAPAAVDRGKDPRSFFTEPEQQRIVTAISTAEKVTSGEIRLHLARRCGKDVFKAAGEVFQRLGMHKTAARNGVLIFLALKEKKFAIIGDHGINTAVPDDFWQETSRIMADFFLRGDFASGIVAGINSAGNQLARYFPYQADDINELPDEISTDV